MKKLLICDVCKRAKLFKAEGGFKPLPKCFTPKPGVVIEKAFCPDCINEAFIQQSNEIFCELGVVKIGSAFAHFIGGIQMLSKHEQLTPYAALGALRSSFEFAKKLKD